MADEHKKGTTPADAKTEKKEEPKKDTEKREHERKWSSEMPLPWWFKAPLEAFFHLFGHQVGHKVLEMLFSIGNERVERIKERPKHLLSFGEVMVKLAEVDPRGYDVINDFMRVELTSTADRNDFQVRTDKMGGDSVEATVAFLELVIAEPDHKARREFLDCMGIIGERAVDPIEKAQRLAKSCGNFLKIRGAEALSWIHAEGDALAMSLQMDTNRVREKRAEIQAQLGTQLRQTEGWSQMWPRLIDSINAWSARRHQRKLENARLRHERLMAKINRNR